MNELNQCFNILEEKHICDFIELRNDWTLFDYHENLIKKRDNKNSYNSESSNHAVSEEPINEAEKIVLI